MAISRQLRGLRGCYGLQTFTPDLPNRPRNCHEVTMSQSISHFAKILSSVARAYTGRFKLGDVTQALYLISLENNPLRIKHSVNRTSRSDEILPSLQRLWIQDALQCLQEPLGFEEHFQRLDLKTPHPPSPP